jgi:dynactin-5
MLMFLHSFIETQSGNRVHRKSILCGAQRIVLEGKTTIHSAVMLRGDLAKVTVGRLTHICNNTVIRPCNRVKKCVDGLFCLKRSIVLRSIHNAALFIFTSGVVSYFNLNIGSHVYIGADCVISAAVIGSHVKIGNNVIIVSSRIFVVLHFLFADVIFVMQDDRCILKDCCEILPNSTLAKDTVVPPMVIMGGSPAVIVGHLPESVVAMRERETRQLFDEFQNV